MDIKEIYRTADWEALYEWMTGQDEFGDAVLDLVDEAIIPDRRVACWPDGLKEPIRDAAVDAANDALRQDADGEGLVIAICGACDDAIRLIRRVASQLGRELPSDPADGSR